MGLTETLRSLHPLAQAFLASSFGWGMTALGAATVFMTKSVSRRLLDGMLGFAAGVMIAASFWSLLAPAIEMASAPAWLPAVVGFLLGGGFLAAADKLIPHLHLSVPRGIPEGVRVNWNRRVLLILAITLHNFPEGLAVGVAFGAAAAGLPAATTTAAIALAIGIGLQNFPEGVAVAMPLRGEGMSRARSFWYGQLSAVVEPVAAVLGAAVVLLARPALPLALSFAAGAMIYVVVEELVPASHEGDHRDLATVTALLGFVVMMALDMAFG